MLARDAPVWVARGPVAGDPDRCVPGQHQRLVAHLVGGVTAGIDPDRPLQASAMAARQGMGLCARSPEPEQDLARDRRLAGPAQGEVADADHRNARIEGPAAGDPPGGGGRPEP